MKKFAILAVLASAITACANEVPQEDEVVIDTAEEAETFDEVIVYE